VYLMRPEIFSYLGEQKPFRIESEMFPRLAKMNELSAFFFQGMWFDISRQKNLKDIITRYQKERSV